MLMDAGDVGELCTRRAHKGRRRRAGAIGWAKRDEGHLAVVCATSMFRPHLREYCYEIGSQMLGCSLDGWRYVLTLYVVSMMVWYSLMKPILPLHRLDSCGSIIRPRA